MSERSLTSNAPADVREPVAAGGGSNWQERARRAEALADHLSLCAAKMAECASECEQHGHAGSLTREMVDRYHASRRYTENALARWADHRATLGTLDQQGAAR